MNWRIKKRQGKERKYNDHTFVSAFGVNHFVNRGYGSLMFFNQYSIFLLYTVFHVLMFQNRKSNLSAFLHKPVDKELFFSTLAHFRWYALLARCIYWCNAQMKTKTSTIQLVKTWAPTP